MRTLTLNDIKTVTGATRDEFDPVLSPLTASALLLAAGCLGAACGAGISLGLAALVTSSAPSMLSSAVGGFIIGHTFCVERMYAYGKHQGLLGYPI